MQACDFFEAMKSTLFGTARSFSVFILYLHAQAAHKEIVDDGWPVLYVNMHVFPNSIRIL